MVLLLPGAGAFRRQPRRGAFDEAFDQRASLRGPQFSPSERGHGPCSHNLGSPPQGRHDDQVAAELLHRIHTDRADDGAVHRPHHRWARRALRCAIWASACARGAGATRLSDRPLTRRSPHPQEPTKASSSPPASSRISWAGISRGSRCCASSRPRGRTRRWRSQLTTRAA